MERLRRVARMALVKRSLAVGMLDSQARKVRGAEEGSMVSIAEGVNGQVQGVDAGVVLGCTWS